MLKRGGFGARGGLEGDARARAVLKRRIDIN